MVSIVPHLTAVDFQVISWYRTALCTFCELHITALHSRAVIQNEVLNYCGGSRKYI